MAADRFDLLEPVGDGPRREVESSGRGGHVLAGVEVGLERFNELPAEAFVREERAELATHDGIGQLPVREEESLERERIRVRDPPTAAQPLRGARGIDEIGIRGGQRTDAVDRRCADGHPRGLLLVPVESPALPGPGVRSRSEAAQHGVERLRHAGQPGPVVWRQDRDAAQEWEDGRQPDPGPDALGTRGGRTEQMADPSGEHLQLLLADARPLGDGVGLGPWRDGDEAVAPIGVQAVPHAGASQAGCGHRIVGDDAEELLERTPAGLHRSGEDVALRGAVAIGHRQRRELVPEQEEAAEGCEEARVEPAIRHGCDAVLPHQPSGDRVAMLQGDQAAVAARRDRPGRALDRHDRLEVERPLGLERLGLGEQVGSVSTFASRPPFRGAAAGRRRASSASIAATAAASGPSCPFIAIVPMRTLARTSSAGSSSSVATAAVSASASGRTRRIAVQRSSFGSIRSLDSADDAIVASLRVWRSLPPSIGAAAGSASPFGCLVAAARCGPVCAVQWMSLGAPGRTIASALEQRQMKPGAEWVARGGLNQQSRLREGDPPHHIGRATGSSEPGPMKRDRDPRGEGPGLLIRGGRR